MLEKKQFYIDGAWVAPVKANDFPVIDPSTEETCAVISLGSDADADLAVAAAKRAFPSWSQTQPAERLALVERLLEIYKRRAPEMAQAMSLEMGAPIDMALEQQTIGAGQRHIENFITAFKNFEFIRPLGPHAPNDRIQMDPIGVVGLITPWNWPMNQVTLKVVPALLAGCTMVHKPSEIAPLSSILFAEFMHEAGVPKGVFNMVNGDGAGVGTRLAVHPDIDMISFTGSTRAGKLISQNAAGTLKRVVLELGGKGANLIFADADKDAVKRGVLHCFNNTGQSCNAPTRLLVPRSLHARAVAAAKAAAEAIKVDDASVDGNHIGPVVSAVQFRKIQGLIEAGIAEGATLVTGGPGLPAGKTRGYFVRPTIFADVHNNMRIAREEIFGPVLAILPYDSEEEAIQIANDTAYGLAAYVQSGSLERARKVATRLRAGSVHINGAQLDPAAPFGGYKQSGTGREWGEHGFKEFLEIKSVLGYQKAA